MMCLTDFYSVLFFSELDFGPTQIPRSHLVNHLRVTSRQAPRNKTTRLLKPSEYPWDKLWGQESGHKQLDRLKPSTFTVAGGKNGFGTLSPPVAPMVWPKVRYPLGYLHHHYINTDLPIHRLHRVYHSVDWAPFHISSTISTQFWRFCLS